MEPAEECRLFRERADAVPDWIWELDTDGVIRYSNPVISELLGYGQDEVLGRLIFDLLAPEDVDKCRDALRQAVAKRQAIRNIIARFVTADASLRSVEVSCVPMIDGADRLVGYRGIARDVTNQLAAERLAQEAEANFKAVVEKSRTGIVIIQDELIAYVNPVLAEAMGYTREELIHTSIWDYIHADDVARSQGLLRRRVAGEYVPMRQTARALTKQGETRYLDFHASLIRHKGAPAVLISLVDITDLVLTQEALRNSQEEYRDLVEKISDWVWQVDETMVYTYVSPKSRELFGYEPEEMVGKTPFDFMPADQAELVLKEIRPFVKKRQPITFVENPMVHRDGHWVWVETNGDPVFDDQGVLRGYRGIDRDITVRKRAEELARESEEQYKTLFESSPLPMWVFCLESLTFLAVNDSMLRHYGYDRDELIGKSIMVIRPEEERSRLEQHLRRLKKGFNKAGVWKHRKKDGTLIDVEITSRSVQWKGKPAAIVLSNDVSERLRAEEQLRKAMSEKETVLRAFPDLYFWLDDRDRIINYHATDLAELYTTPEQFRGKTFAEVLPEEVGSSFARAIEEVRKTGAAAAVEYLLEVQGEERFYEARVLPLPENQTMVIVRNITERKLAEAALRESREMSQLVMNNIPQYVFWKDTNSAYLGCNRSFARAVGLSDPEEIVGKTDYDLPGRRDEADALHEWDRRVMEEDMPHLLQTEAHVAVDGSLRWMDTNRVPLHDAQGKVVGILGTYEDITERRLALQALEEAEEKYRSLVEETMVGVYLIQDDKFAYANQRMLDIFAAESGGLVGKSPLDFVAPEDRAVVAENIRKRLTGETRTIRYTFRAVRADGIPIDVEVHGALTSYKGKPAIIGSLSDITERKRYVEAVRESEERYRQLFEHSPDMIFVLSAVSGAFTSINPAVTAVLGYEAYDVLGKTPADISPEFQPDGERSAEKFERKQPDLLKQGTMRLEWVYRAKDGSLVECEVSLVTYRLRGEALIQAIVRDVRERKHAEETRRRLERDLEMQKRSFYRETILSVTNGKLDICEYKDVEDCIIRSTGGITVDDYSEVAAARRQVEEFCEAHGITGDRGAAFMVGVGEAITNAVKHGVEGKVYVGEDENRVWVVVTDKGKGIASLILPRAVLLRGFSTKPSLGLGYSIMLEVSDLILLNTGEQGTSVVLMKDKVEQDMTVLPQYLPDTWDNVPG